MLEQLRYKLATALLPGPARALSAGRLNFLFTGQRIQVLPAELITYIRAYTDNDLVYAVQDWKSSKVAAAPPLLYRIVSQKGFRAYRELARKSLEQPSDRLLLLQRKAARETALEPVDVHPLLSVLERPNPMQNRVELFYALSTMLDVVGTVFLYGNKLAYGPNRGRVVELWRLPELGMLVEGMSLMRPPTQYRALGIQSVIPASQVLMMRRFNPLAEINQQYHWGLSRLEPLRESVLTKYHHANLAEAEAFQNRGPSKMVFPKGAGTDDIDVEDMKKVQADLDAKFTGKFKKVVTNSVELGSIDIGSSPVDLGILESYDNMLERVCAVYHTRKEVHSSGKQSTYNNLTEARKSSLTDGVLPDQALLYDYLNEFFVSSYNTETEQFYLEPDLDYYPELQEDQKKKAEYLDHLALTENQRLEAFGYEPDPHPLMSVPMIPSGRVPISDFMAQQEESGDEEEAGDEDDGSYKPAP